MKCYPHHSIPIGYHPSSSIPTGRVFHEVIVSEALSPESLAGPVPPWLPENMRASLEKGGKRMLVECSNAQGNPSASKSPTPLKRRRVDLEPQQDKTNESSNHLDQHTYESLAKNRSSKSPSDYLPPDMLKLWEKCNETRPNPVDTSIPQKHPRQSEIIHSLSETLLTSLGSYDRKVEGLESDLSAIIQEIPLPGGAESSAIQHVEMNLLSLTPLLSRLSSLKRQLAEAEATRNSLSQGVDTSKRRRRTNISALDPTMIAHSVRLWTNQINKLLGEITDTKQSLKQNLKAVLETGERTSENRNPRYRRQLFVG